MHVVERVAHWAEGYRKLPMTPEVLHHAKRAVIDLYAAMIPGAIVSPAVLLEKSLSEELDRGKARLALGRSATVRAAALINGSAAHTVEVDDIFRDGIYHPGAPTIPAALALAQARGASGAEFLRAVVVGYEISTRIGAAMGKAHYKYWHNTGTIGVFGACAAACELLQLDAKRFAHALATVTTFSAALQQAFRMDSMSKPLHAGRAAEAGVTAALAAREGVTGSLDVIEGDAGFGVAMGDGPDWDKAFESLGAVFNITRMTFKNHTCCGHTFAAIDGAMALQARMKVAAREIERIRVGSYRAAKEVSGYESPNTPAEARFSLKYVVATALTHGSVRFAAFEPERMNDPETRELMAKIDVAIDPELDAAFPKQRAARVVIVTRDGREEELLQPTRIGDPEAPLSDAQLDAKYLELAGPVLGEDKTRKLLADLWTLDKARSVPLTGLAAAVFAPRAVALVGASGDAAKNTARPQRYLLKHGYAGRIFPINATRSTVLDLPAFKSLVDTKEKIEHAFIMVEDVESALEDCGRAGVPVASVFSDGFADVGEKGVARQKKLAARAKELGVRLLGPNSMGMINLSGRCALTVNAVLEMDAPPVGGTSIVSQSGTMLGTVLSRGAARGLGFSKLVSVGNEADLGVGELVEMLAADAETKTILLFLETVRNAEALARGARAAHTAGKPVIAYKLGRSKLGERLAQSHTGALAGEDAALDAYFRDCGIARVDMLETLIEAGPLFAGRRPPNLARPPRVSVVTTTGGGAASVVDRLGMQGIDVASPDPHAPIMDLTMGRKSATYGAVVEELMSFEGSDAVLAVVGSSAQFHPQLAVEPILKAKRGAKPLAVFMTPHAEKSLALLAQAGIAAFRTPETCADAFNAFFSWRIPSQRKKEAPREWPKDIPEREALTEEGALRLFGSLGVPVVETAVAAAPDYAHSIPYPVAVKLLSADVAHKSDVGGVALGVGDLQELRQNALKIGAATGQAVDRVLVQKMEAGLGEAIIGYRDDPVVGPLVLVGAGGILAELYNDVVLRMAPVDEAGAAEMVAEVRGFAALRGYRGRPQGDLKALAQAVAAMSRLALLAGRPVQEAEANPVIVKELQRGVVAVDALAVLKPPLAEGET